VKKPMLKVNYKGKEKVESESITFRIEKNILEELREDSEQKVKRINTLANRIFKSYVNWHRLPLHFKLKIFFASFTAISYNCIFLFVVASILLV
jgi:hypothetical protein